MRLLLKEREAEKEAELQPLSYENYDPNDRMAWYKDPHLRSVFVAKDLGSWAVGR